MSPAPLALNDDLLRLQGEGYEIAIRQGQVVMTSVPYVTAGRKVKLGTLMTPLNENGGVIGAPSTHQAWFQGDEPCDAAGKRIVPIYLSPERRDLGDGLISEHAFSAKGPEGLPQSYHRLFHNYLGHICSHAAVLEPGATAAAFRTVVENPEDDVLCYRDSNSARGRFVGATSRFRGLKVAIIGCGGTGSYLLDFISKTPVAEIHLFDGDVFLQHNAFRAPGAASFDVLKAERKKVEYLKEVYSAMHRGIHVHADYMGPDSLALLDGMSFTFISVDKPAVKGPVVDHLEAKGMSFVDVGMGVEATESSLYGLVRTTLSTPEDRATFRRLVDTTAAADDDGAYGANIQIAELNALNAAMAIIKWKKHIGFYHDQRKESHSVYSLSDQVLVKEPTDE